MTLDEVLLQKLAKWRPDSAGQTLDVQDAEAAWTVTLNAEHVDMVGCRLREMSLRPTRETPAVDLKDRAERITSRVTGLLETLRLLEVDGTRNVALLRSDKPGQRGDERFYYEVLLEGSGALVLRRYQAPRGGESRRQQVPFTLTHEALANLVRDLIASA
jgi:hypothetical protein